MSIELGELREENKHNENVSYEIHIISKKYYLRKNISHEILKELTKMIFT